MPIPDPAGSANEKWHPTRWGVDARIDRLRQLLLAEGVEEGLALGFSMAMARREDPKTFERRELLEEFSRWANTHAHEFVDDGTIIIEWAYEWWAEDPNVSGYSDGDAAFGWPSTAGSNPFKNGDGGNRVRWYESEVNGLPSFYSQGGLDTTYVELNDPFPQPYTLIAIVRVDEPFSTSTNNYLFNGTHDFTVADNGLKIYTPNPNTTSKFTPFVQGETYLLEIYIDDTDTTVFSNGTELTISGAPAGTDALGVALYIGSTSGGRFNTEFAIPYFALKEGSLSSKEQAHLLDWAQRYNLS